MKKLAKELQQGDRIQIGDQKFLIQNTEISDIGKQGKRKVRIEASNQQGEKLVVIRPDDYPFNCEE
jgi:translation elongation factor P/translation initiation factor 5A